MGGIKERESEGWVYSRGSRRCWESLAPAQAAFSLLPTLLLVIVWNKIKQANFVMSYLQKSVNPLWPPGWSLAYKALYMLILTQSLPDLLSLPPLPIAEFICTRNYEVWVARPLRALDRNLFLTPTFSCSWHVPL